MTESGTYGQCRQCDLPIAIERLRALPWATECVECRARRARR
jgi:DnaK suppressor protein